MLRVQARPSSGESADLDAAGTSAPIFQSLVIRSQTIMDGIATSISLFTLHTQLHLQATTSMAYTLQFSSELMSTTKTCDPVIKMYQTLHQILYVYSSENSNVYGTGYV